jgi:hypothetical protein
LGVSHQVLAGSASTSKTRLAPHILGPASRPIKQTILFDGLRAMMIWPCA